MIWILLILIIIVTLYLYFFKNALFEKHKGIIEFIIIIVTVFFTVEQLNSSAEDFNDLISRLEKIVGSIEESKETLKEVQSSLERLPPTIDDFSDSIDSLNFVIITQKNQLDKTLYELNYSLNTFQSSIETMNNKLNRKPRIVIEVEKKETDTTFILKKIWIENQIFIIWHYISLMKD